MICSNPAFSAEGVASYSNTDSPSLLVLTNKYKWTNCIYVPIHDDVQIRNGTDD